MTTLDTSYRVRLSAFEGPLDLLLFLIRKHEIDIHDIPVARIAEQYVAFLVEASRPAHTSSGAAAGPRTLGGSRLDIDEAGEFLVMAATLMELKSRMLLPQETRSRVGDGQANQAAQEDPRAELVRQLLEYKRLRDAADALEQRGIDWQNRFGTARAGVDDAALEAQLAQHVHDVDLEELHLIDLVEAFGRIASTVNFERMGEHQVAYDDTPLEIHQEDILLQLGDAPESQTLLAQRLDELRPEVRAQLRPGEAPLRALLATRTRSEMIGMFLALLELVRHHKVSFRTVGEEREVFLLKRSHASDETGQ
jgi:segregation and condensation protein A